MEKYEGSIKLLRFISEKRNNIYEEEINEIEDSIYNNIFEVAIIGEFSVGKSTFLNSIIGKSKIRLTC